MRKVFSLLSVVILAVFATLFSTTIFAQDSGVPDDFELTLVSAPFLLEDPLQVEGLTIHADGAASISARLGDDGEIPAHDVEIGTDSVAALYGVIQAQDFFGLGALYEDPNILDGDYAIMTITADGQTHSVRTVNIGVDAFDTIALWVNSYFPVEEMVLYNAFLDSGDEGDGQ